jgi:Protein of unknown function (DUF3667)
MPNCLNCQQPLAGAYCAQCGQPANTQRLSSRQLAQDVFASLTNLDRGLFHTILDLTRRPAGLIGDYLAGRRAPYYHWLKYLLLFTGLATLVTLSSKGFQGFMKSSMTKMGTDVATAEKLAGASTSAEKVIAEMQVLFFSNYNLIYLAFLPFAALFFYLFFRGRGYNLAEHLVAQAFALGHYNLICALLFTLLLPFEGQAWYGSVFVFVLFSTAVIQFIYLFIVYLGLMPGRGWAIFLRAFLAFGLAYFFYSSIISVVIGAFVGYNLERH